MTAAEMPAADQVTVTQLGDTHAVIGLTPSGFGPSVLLGELRDRHGQPMPRSLFTAPATERGLLLLLDRLTVRSQAKGLSHRQVEILEMRAAGASLRQIADQFHISISHASRLCRRAS